MNDIPYDWGTAVNVQTMVFGNMGDTSGTGVAFTRNPVHRREEALRRVPDQRPGRGRRGRHPHPAAHRHTCRRIMPDVYEQFVNIATTLENHYRDMQDMEFTIERGKLYMLQTRNGKRTAAAALKIAVDLVDEGMITDEEAVLQGGAASSWTPCCIRSSTPLR